MSKAFTREDDAVEEEILRRPIGGSVHLTRDGISKIRAELLQLEQDRSHAEPARLNAIDRRIQEIEQTLAVAQVVEVRSTDSDVVRFGATVTVREGSGDETSYMIVGPAEADPGRGRISSASPLARALLNRSVGEHVKFTYPAGEDVLEILSVTCA